MVWRTVELRHQDEQLFSGKPKLDAFLDHKLRRRAPPVGDQLTRWAADTYDYAKSNQGSTLPKETLKDVMATLIGQWPPFTKHMSDQSYDLPGYRRCARLVAYVIIEQEWETIREARS